MAHQNSSKGCGGQVCPGPLVIMAHVPFGLLIGRVCGWRIGGRKLQERQDRPSSEASPVPTRRILVFIPKTMENNNSLLNRSLR